jgi:hypothetical protein
MKDLGAESAEVPFSDRHLLHVQAVDPEANVGPNMGVQDIAHMHRSPQIRINQTMYVRLGIRGDGGVKQIARIAGRGANGSPKMGVQGISDMHRGPRIGIKQTMHVRLGVCGDGGVKQIAGIAGGGANGSPKMGVQGTVAPASALIRPCTSAWAFAAMEVVWQGLLVGALWLVMVLSRTYKWTTCL